VWWLKGLALGYTVGLVGLAAHAITAVTFVIVRIMEPFWLISGTVAAAALITEEEKSDGEGHPHELAGQPAHPDPGAAR
jgi:hypothetical protein